MNERDGRAGSGGPPEDEQWREFQEFKRFQEFLRYSQTASPDAASPDVGSPGAASSDQVAQPDADATPPRGTELPGTELQPWAPAPVAARPSQVPAAQQPPRVEPPVIEQPPAGSAGHAMHEQLAGMQRQLTELTDAQRAAERAANPPLWRKILRNRWLHRLAFLVILLAIGGWLINHYFGPDDNETPAQARRPGTEAERREIQGAAGPKQAVYDVYRFTSDASTARSSGDVATAQRVATLACNNFFTDAAAAAYARDRGAPDCVSAFQNVPVDSAGEYGRPSLLTLPPARTDTYTVSSCRIKVSGGPLLGEFELRRQPHGTWAITGHRNEPTPCPAPPPTTTPAN